eukprot:GHVN01097805.1.p1 GENE.GHVN01097805.1~~GHVN01097805.1.p1  ORF type:complete len:216 (-),score=6.83 GHVN01097805.1:201-848(-)
MWVGLLGSFVLFAAVLGSHAKGLSQYDKLQAETTKLANMVQELKNGSEAMKTEINALKTENEAMKTEVERLSNTKISAVTPMCFSAVKTSTQSVVSGDKILFEEELVDTHDTFSPVLGVYGIPQTGVWEVIVTLYKPYTSASYNDVTARLYVGTTFLTRIDLRTYNSNYDVTHSTSTIIRQFNAGDALSVQSASTGSFYGNTGYKSSQFSAKLLG